MAMNIRSKYSMASVGAVYSSSSSENGDDENYCPKTSIISSRRAADWTVAAPARGTRRALGPIGNSNTISQRRGPNNHLRGDGGQDCAVPKRSCAAAAQFITVYEDVEMEPKVAAGVPASRCTSLEPSHDEAPDDLCQVYKLLTPDVPTSSNTGAGSPMIQDSPCSTAGNCSSQEMYEVQGDQEVVNDPLVLSEYSDYIYIYMCNAEVRYRPFPGYMSRQRDVSYAMRSVLVDWLCDVVSTYGLQRETLHLAVGYSDRFLSRVSVMRSKLQLLGTAALFVAAKYEEIQPPDVHDLTYMTADAYSTQQVLRMEQLLLQMLSFDLSMPTFCQFVRFYAQRLSTPGELVGIAMYLGDQSLLDGERYLPILPSVVAAAALALASLVSGHEWPSQLEKVTGYSPETLQPCLCALHITYTTR